jgi:phospholipase/carboxylesterase
MLKYVHHIHGPDSPTLVLLHGYGSNKEDLFGLKSYLPPLNLLCLEAPIALQPYGFAWYPIQWENGAKMIDNDDVLEATKMVESSISQWKEQHGIHGKILLGGFSQGAITSIRMLLNGFQAEAFVLMSGYALPEWMDELKNLSNPAPIFQSHGTSDPVIPFSWAKASAENLSHLPYYTFHQYSMAHSLNADCLKDINDFLGQVL